MKPVVLELKLAENSSSRVAPLIKGVQTRLSQTDTEAAAVPDRSMPGSTPYSSRPLKDKPPLSLPVVQVGPFTTDKV